ncbi:hypothetical protein GF373_16070 [bacterium]|nr:hypothetical protein [bacterium]
MKTIRNLIFFAIIALLFMAYFSSDYSKDGSNDLQSMLSDLRNTVHEKFPELRNKMDNLVSDVEAKLQNKEIEVADQGAAEVKAATQTVADVTSAQKSTDSADRFDPLELMIRQLQKEDAGELADRMRSLLKEMKALEQAGQPVESATAIK